MPCQRPPTEPQPARNLAPASLTGLHPLTTAILRALRDTQPPAAEEAQKVGAAAAPVRAPIAGKAAAALVVTPAQMAPRLRLLALACVHDRVRDAVWPLASGEGAYERLTRLLRAALGGKPSRHRPRRRGTARGALARRRGAQGAAAGELAPSVSKFSLLRTVTTAPFTRTRYTPVCEVTRHSSTEPRARRSQEHAPSSPKHRPTHAEPLHALTPLQHGRCAALFAVGSSFRRPT